MTKPLALAGLLVLASAGLTGCDRVKSALAGHEMTAATTPEVCANPTTGPDLSAERAVEAKALAAHADTARRDRDLLSISYQGRTIATMKGCDSFYSGVLRLRNPKTGELESYDVFTTLFDRSVVIDHDGTPILFEGGVVASPDGRYVASGKASTDLEASYLTITDWTSAKRMQVAFAITCTPKAWSTDGLKAECVRLNYESEATMTATSDSWVLRETKASLLPPEARDAGAPGSQGLQTYTSEIVWPEDTPDWIGGDDGSYRPLKGAAIPLRLPSMSLTLAEPSSGKLVTYPLATSDNGFQYRLMVDTTTAYDIGTAPRATPDGRFLTLFDNDSLLIDWSTRTDINFESTGCVDGKWLSDTELQAWCYSADETIHYVEARITKAANGTWTYNETGPVRKTIDHKWQSYRAKGFVPRRGITGEEGRPALNVMPSPQVIA